MNEERDMTVEEYHDFIRSLGQALSCLPDQATILGTIDDLKRSGSVVTSEHWPNRGPCYWGSFANGDALLSWLINRDLELLVGDSYWDEARKVVLVATGGLQPFAVRSDDDGLVMQLDRRRGATVCFLIGRQIVAHDRINAEEGEQLLAVRRLLIKDAGLI
jgi:hypothetical protein